MHSWKQEQHVHVKHSPRSLSWSPFVCWWWMLSCINTSWVCIERVISTSYKYSIHVTILMQFCSRCAQYYTHGAFFSKHYSENPTLQKFPLCKLCGLGLCAGWSSGAISMGACMCIDQPPWCIVLNFHLFLHVFWRVINYLPGEFRVQEKEQWKLCIQPESIKLHQRDLFLSEAEETQTFSCEYSASRTILVPGKCHLFHWFAVLPDSDKEAQSTFSCPASAGQAVRLEISLTESCTWLVRKKFEERQNTVFMHWNAKQISIGSIFKFLFPPASSLQTTWKFCLVSSRGLITQTSEYGRLWGITLQDFWSHSQQLRCILNLRNTAGLLWKW